MTQKNNKKTLEELQAEIQEKLEGEDEVSQDDILEEAIRNGLSAEDEEKLMEWLSEKEFSIDDEAEESDNDEENSELSYSDHGSWQYNSYQKTTILPDGRKMVAHWTLPNWIEKLRRFFNAF